MKVLPLAALGSILLLAPGCKRETPPPPATPPPSPTAAATATPSPATASPTPTSLPAGHRKMANCPTTVGGAKLLISATPDAVEVTITATGAEAVTEIRERSRHLAEVAVKDPATPKHSGEGEGGGMLGQCPVVLNDTTLVAADVEGGAKITIKPNKAENFAWLKKEVSARAAKTVR